ncbi:hypothetical protein FHX37_3582 [Haloactinospora alba]|uniref:Uncharacterized protein n=1 Tax=Haloactinospora alba TaxID=405555 RepID=A0A543NP57_9ACTN|nr:hypothetical protein [Haloactinospora alba]TQN33556.1 hypothetical protein FHX37_3582 [Haloactinospora alba]
MRFSIVLGAMVAVTGAVLFLAFPDLEFYWFRGGPLGAVLMIAGAAEAGEGAWRVRGRLRSGERPETAGGGGNEADTDRGAGRSE